MLSVVIPTYRKPELLARTLAALAEQIDTLEEQVEIVVVDDGSGEGTAQLLRQWQERLPLCVERPPTNEGRARARNRGWRAARGETVYFLDDDILLDAGALKAHVDAQRREPGVYLGDVVTAPEIVDSSLFAYLDSRGIAKHPPGARVPARYLLTQNVSLPRAAMETVGGFDERFVAYGFEDMELAFRLEDALSLGFYRLAGARGLHIHHHSLDDYLVKKRECGRHTLPLVAELHPERVGEMGLAALPGLPRRLGGRPGALRAALRVSFSIGGASVARGLLPLLPAAARHRAYDYLVLASYAAGLREARLSE